MGIIRETAECARSDVTAAGRQYQECGQGTLWLALDDLEPLSLYHLADDPAGLSLFGEETRERA
jgi:hypothetical protein